ncbi:MAG: NAD-dependent epimerase/dehydratase family protein [Euryarchaeota archaeon]|jgi:UDP-glucose 4-epimerase|nr:NAD-dependent epimerase/dehydratase family protein [Euryarchaeota archaeon]
MELTGKRLLVTGGAGTIGSHLTERLLEDNEVLVADDLSNGRREWVPHRATFVECDLTNPEEVESVLTEEIDAVIHLAAAKLVDTDAPRRQFEDNTQMTYNLLERAREVGVDEFVFTSSSTVYGEAPSPTPEDYAPLEPISIYGAAKLADEHLLSVYAHSHGMTIWNFRFANIVGSRLRGAVVPDFIEKLRSDPEQLAILGDGHQEKSYMHIDECIDAMKHVIENTSEPMNTYNIGTRTTTSVTRIADIVSEEMGLDPDYEYTGGKRGWTGDIPRMRLSIEKLSALGFTPELSSDDAVRKAARELIEEI